MDVFWYKKGQLEHVHERHLEMQKRSSTPHEKVWVDVSAFSVKDLAYLQKVFGISPRTIESIQRGTSRPNIEEYDTYLSVTTYGLDEHVKFIELHFLTGKDFIITIHKRPVHSFELLKQNADMTKQLLARDTEFIMHYLMSAEVDKYATVLERFDKDVTTFEERVLHDRSSKLVRDLFELRHHLVTFKHHIAPQKDLLYVLSRPGAKFIIPSCADLFRDLQLRVVYATDSIDNYRDILNGTLEVHLSVTSNHLNDIIKVLTVVSTVFMPLTLIASIYGMNFTNMPELTWQYGYFFALAFMTIIGVGMVLMFKRLRWV
jgi:magnesium transporter